MPCVSVCIPAYNHGRFLPKAVAGILGQSFQDFEIFIRDDASTDETPRVLKSFSDPRIHCARNDANAGWAANTSLCFGEAKGKYVCILNADDGWRPQFLETMVAVMEANPDVGFAFGAYTQVDEEGKELGLVRHFSADRIFSGEEFFARNVLQNIVGAPTVIVRSTCYQKAGVYDPRFCYMADWEMWLRMSLHFDVAYVATPLAFWRLHPENLSRGADLADNRYREEKAILEKTFSRLPDGKRRLLSLQGKARFSSAQRLYGYAQHKILRGDLDLFRRQALLAVKMNPRIALRHLVIPKIVLSYFGKGPFDFLRSWKNNLARYWR